MRPFSCGACGCWGAFSEVVAQANFNLLITMTEHMRVSAYRYYAGAFPKEELTAAYRIYRLPSPLHQ